MRKLLSRKGSFSTRSGGVEDKSRCTGQYKVIAKSGIGIAGGI